jgi:hypothetical protein
MAEQNVCVLSQIIGCVRQPLPDGSLYFTAVGPKDDFVLVAPTRFGKEKWRLALGSRHGFEPPTIASDGTLFLVSCDSRITAVNPDGTVKWIFKPSLRYSKVLPKSLGDLKGWWTEVRREYVEWTSPPILTPDGTLYASFGPPYDTVYALKVGVGLSTNCPWPMANGNPQMTRRVAERPKDGAAKAGP